MDSIARVLDQPIDGCCRSWRQSTRTCTATRSWRRARRAPRTSAAPGCYLMIGNGEGEGACTVHNPGYDVHDDNLAIGAAYWALLAEQFMGGQ
jgi:metal-dependent amidase/aminoacylase/carboxypeptidase family protein